MDGLLYIEHYIIAATAPRGHCVTFHRRHDPGESGDIAEPSVYPKLHNGRPFVSPKINSENPHEGEEWTVTHLQKRRARYNRTYHQ